MPQDQPKAKRKKESFLAGMENRLRETAHLGHVLATEPRAFPGALGQVLKRFARTVWYARGGGLYACGFVVTFLWLEATTLVGELVSSGSLAAFFSEQLLEFIFRFTVQSLTNTVSAFLWPLWVIQVSPVWGSATLGMLYILFPRYLKEPLTQWLFHDDKEAQPDEPENGTP